MRNISFLFAGMAVSTALAVAPATAQRALDKSTPEKAVREIAAACEVMIKNNIRSDCAEFLKPHRPAVIAVVPAPVVPIPVPAVAKSVAAAPKATTVDGSAGEGFALLRQDQYDQISYIWQPFAYEVLQGAAISYSKDQIAKNQSVNVKGFLGYSAVNWTNDNLDGCGSRVFDRTNLIGYGFGPFIQANGTYNEPTTASEKSALRLGADANAHFCGGSLFPQQDVQILPYAQTDFRGKAGIAGFDALWEPFNERMHIGGRLDVLSPKLVGYYFRIIGEANVFEVRSPGLTNFMPNTTYALLGGTAEARAVLFENNPIAGPWLCGTVALIGTTRYLYDAVSRKPIYLLGAEIDYKLGKSPSTAKCNNPPTGIASTSVALTYNQGTDPMTFVKQNAYKASLKFAF
jgi:hypothetical protein